MKIQYASDLHLEFGENWNYLKANPLEVAGDILILAGDINYLGENYSEHPFWDWASENYKQVLVCPGNHEFYKFYDIATLTNGYELAIRPNVRVCYNSVVHLDGVDIILSPLWAHIDVKNAYYTEQVVSDFRRIIYDGNLLTFSEFNAEHRKCLQFIQDAVASSTAHHKIVVTHHVPSFILQNPQYKDSIINGAFIIELQDYIKKSDIEYWIYGHSHYNCDARIGNTLCLSNQLGYVFQNEHLTFNRSKIINV